MRLISYDTAHLQIDAVRPERACDPHEYQAATFSSQYSWWKPFKISLV